MPNEAMTIEIVGDSTTMQEGMGASTPPNIVIGPDNQYYDIPADATPEKLTSFFKRMGGAVTEIGKEGSRILREQLPSDQTFEELGQAVLDPKFYGYLAESAKKYYTEPENALSTAALATTGVPVVGDALGLSADLTTYYRHPEERTGFNFALTGFGMIPFIPPMVGIIRNEKSQIFPGSIERGLDTWIGGTEKSKMFNEVAEAGVNPVMQRINDALTRERPTFFDQLIGANPNTTISTLVKEWMHTTYRKYMYERMGTINDEVRKFIDSGTGTSLTEGADTSRAGKIEERIRKAELDAKTARDQSETNYELYHPNDPNLSWDEEKELALQEYANNVREETVSTTQRGELYERATDAQFEAQPARATKARFPEESFQKIVRDHVVHRIFGYRTNWDSLSAEQKTFVEKWMKTASYWNESDAVWSVTDRNYLRPDYMRTQRIGVSVTEIPNYVAAKVAEGLYEAAKAGDIKVNNINKLTVERALEISNKALEKKLMAKFEVGDLIKKNVMEHNKKLGYSKKYDAVEGSPKGTGWYKYDESVAKDDVRIGLSVDTQGAVRVDDEHVMYGKTAWRSATPGQKRTGDICVGQCDHNAGERIAMVDMATMKLNKNKEGGLVDNEYANNVYRGAHKIYSLRDLDSGQTNAVIQVGNGKPDKYGRIVPKGQVMQAKGPGNGTIEPQYHKQVIDLLNDIRVEHNMPASAAGWDPDFKNFEGVVVQKSKPKEPDVDEGWTVVSADTPIYEWEYGYAPDIRRELKGAVESIKEAIPGPESGIPVMIAEVNGFRRRILDDLNTQRKQIISTGNPNNKLREVETTIRHIDNILNEIVDDLNGADKAVKFYNKTDSHFFDATYKFDENRFNKTLKQIETFKKHPAWAEPKIEKTPNSPSFIAEEFAGRHQFFDNAWNRGELTNNQIATFIMQAADDIVNEGLWNENLRFIEVFETYLREQMGLPREFALRLSTILDRIDNWYDDAEDVIQQFLDQHRDQVLMQI